MKTKEIEKLKENFLIVKFFNQIKSLLKINFI